MPTQVFKVTGMTCDHCVAAVTQEVSALPGVDSVAIELRAEAISDVTVTSAEALDLEVVRAAVDEAGYDLAE
jgi:copper chaperone CopZ